jgi:Tfp pilus assembly protein PilN
MIHVNLLPVEQRRGNRLPLRVLGAGAGATLVAAGAIGWFAVVWLVDLGGAEQRLAALEQQLAAREPKLAYHAQLEQNRKDYQERVQTIQSIAQSRRLWSKFCDELIDVVNNNGNTDRHLTWFGGITMKSDPKGSTVNLMSAAVQDDDTSKVANLHDDFDAAPFAADVVSRSEPTWKLELNKARTPAASLVFPLTIQLRPMAPAAADKTKPKSATTAPAAQPQK